MPEESVPDPLLVVLGPTASGKTRLAVALAASLGAEIISADSRQVFRGMDIGTGKDLSEYNYKAQYIPHHLIDIKAAGERYNVDAFKTDFYTVYSKLSAANILPILCGGTGMYIHSVLQNQAFTAVPLNNDLRDDLAGMSLSSLISRLEQFPISLTAHADRSTIKRMIRAIEIATFLLANTLETQVRPIIKPFVVGLMDDVQTRREKIAIRLEKRLSEGMIEEVEGLLTSGVSAEMLSFYGLEYKIIVSYLQHKISLFEMKVQLYNGICQFAKRQMTFFRKMEKDGVNIHWYQADMETEILRDHVLTDFIKDFPQYTSALM
jgi:tRNA dimethylallyltransferase